MIVELTIRNFAIIEEVHLQFHQGLNVLTGETGAGKSILLDALGLLLGGRGSQEMIRYGAERTEVEGLFQIGESHPIASMLNEFGIDGEEGMLILHREMGKSGKSICRINGKLVPLSFLREIGEKILHIHSQEDHHQIMQTTQHLHWLDAYGARTISEKLREYKEIFHQYQRIYSDYEHLRQDEKETVQRIDLLRYQYQEITQASLEPHEEEKLTEERSRLVHAEKITYHGEGAYNALTGENKALDWLGMAMGHLEEVAEVEPFLKEKFQQVEEAFFLLEEVSRDLSAFLDELDVDQGRLSEVEDRLHLIQQLKRKYGDSIHAILEYAATIEEDLERLENKDFLLQKYVKELTELKEELLLAAAELTETRCKAADEMSAAIHQELKHLYLDKAKFRVQVEDIKDDLVGASLEIKGGEYGLNKVEFLVATNPGEPLKPLTKIASGGELSRIALALRTVLAKVDDVDTLVFDEVDTGVSGRISQAIGEKLHHISKERQVLAITHHPQVAAYADKHYLIQKETLGERAITQVKELSEEERIQELARMIGGKEITPSALQHARELRDASRGSGV
ncbi:DNA repair protein RecN [[Clostridium] ultunense Esp]|nr:DNA repair protein RecN [[Clostridium] ultunense Esp]